MNQALFCTSPFILETSGFFKKIFGTMLQFPQSIHRKVSSDRGFIPPKISILLLLPQILSSGDKGGKERERSPKRPRICFSYVSLLSEAFQ